MKSCNLINVSTKTSLLNWYTNKSFPEVELRVRIERNIENGNCYCIQLDYDDDNEEGEEEEEKENKEGEE